MRQTNSMSRIRCTERLHANASLLRQFFVQVADSTSEQPLTSHAGGGDSRNHPKSPPPNFDRSSQPTETKELNPLRITTRYTRQIAVSQTGPELAAAISPPALGWELPTPLHGRPRATIVYTFCSPGSCGPAHIWA